LTSFRLRTLNMPPPSAFAPATLKTTHGAHQA
jgi:hypothetical protein